VSAWIWAAGAIVTAFVEMHAPGFYLIWIALGAAITAVATWLAHLVLEAQLITFAMASACCCVGGHFVYRRATRRAPGNIALNERERQMVGAHAVVAEALTNGQGKIRLGDTVWLAEGPDLPQGAKVVVTAMRGTTAVIATLG
jgi:hypothetical protein